MRRSRRRRSDSLRARRRATTSARRCSRALRERARRPRFFGVAGPRMRAAGCEAWQSSDELAVMGLAEIVRHLPRLLGCDANSAPHAGSAAASLHRHRRAGVQPAARGAAQAPRGIATVQYVSPQVWAWRQGRVRTIGAAVDLVLCLLPFEAELLRRATRCTRCSSDIRSPTRSRCGRIAAPARAALGLPDDARVVAMLPGSRRARCNVWARRSRPPMPGSARRAPGLVIRRADGQRRAARQRSTAALARAAPRVSTVRLVDGRAQEALAACDAVLRRSGTATLETRARQAADGRCLPCGAADGLAAARLRAGQDTAFLATEPAGRPGPRARVLSGSR